MRRNIGIVQQDVFRDAGLFAIENSMCLLWCQPLCSSSFPEIPGFVIS